MLDIQEIWIHTKNCCLPLTRLLLAEVGWDTGLRFLQTHTIKKFHTKYDGGLDWWTNFVVKLFKHFTATLKITTNTSIFHSMTSAPLLRRSCSKSETRARTRTQGRRRRGSHVASLRSRQRASQIRRFRPSQHQLTVSWPTDAVYCTGTVPLHCKARGGMGQGQNGKRSLTALSSVLRPFLCSASLESLLKTRPRLSPSEETLAMGGMPSLRWS